MRAFPLVLLLAALPATAQVDPALVGSWTLDVIEQAPESEMKVVSMTLVITADGRLLAKMTGARPGEAPRTETEEERITAVDGRLDDGRSPVDYTLLDADTLRISDDNLSLRFRRVSN